MEIDPSGIRPALVARAKRRIDAGLYDNPRILKHSLAALTAQVIMDCRDDEVRRAFELEKANWDQKNDGDRFE